jgi:hypothetical protein
VLGPNVAGRVPSAWQPMRIVSRSSTSTSESSSASAPSVSSSCSRRWVLLLPVGQEIQKFVRVSSGQNLHPAAGLSSRAVDLGLKARGLGRRTRSAKRLILRVLARGCRQGIATVATTRAQPLNRVPHSALTEVARDAWLSGRVTLPPQMQKSRLSPALSPLLRTRADEFRTSLVSAA